MVRFFLILILGFEKYRGGLDTVHDLTGELSVYTNWRNIEIMFHVSTFLPHEGHDPQKVIFLFFSRIIIFFVDSCLNVELSSDGYFCIYHFNA